jgi:hypothetical protein
MKKKKKLFESLLSSSRLFVAMARKWNERVVRWGRSKSLLFDFFQRIYFSVRLALSDGLEFKRTRKRNLVELVNVGWPLNRIASPFPNW